MKETTKIDTYNKVNLLAFPGGLFHRLSILHVCIAISLVIIEVTQIFFLQVICGCI